MRGYLMQKGKSSLVVAVLLIMVLTSACGGAKSTTGTSASPPSKEATATAAPTPKEKVVLKAIAHTSWIKTGMEVVLKDAAEKAGIDLQIEKVAEGETGDKLIQTRFATNDKPDLLFFYSSQDNVSKLGKPEDNFALQEGQEWFKNFDTKQWTGSMDYDGKFYGAPYGGVQAGVVFYNKKVFESLSLKIPTTVDEFMKVSEAIQKAGKIPFYLAGKDAWTLQLTPMVTGATADYLDTIKQINVNKKKLTDLASLKEGIQLMLDLKQKGLINKTFLSDSYDNAEKAIANGDAGMYVMASWMMNDIVTKFPDKVNDLGAFLLPTADGKPHVPLFAPNALYVIKGGKNQEAAQRFVNYFESIATQNIFFGNEGGIPAIKGVTKLTLTPAELDGKKFVELGVGVPAYSAGLKYSAGDFAAIVQGSLAGGYSPDKALETLQKEFEKNAKAKEDPNFK